MSNIPINYGGISLTSKFQAYNSGNVSGYTPVATNIKYNGVDINTPTPLYSPRDNKAGNAATSTGAIISNTKDLTLLFNKNGATYDVTISGSTNATGSIITPTLVYSSQSPTANGVNVPTFTVPQPTVDAVNTTCLAVGTYTFNNSLTSSAVLGGVIVIKLPGNYSVGTISGSFTINSSGPLAVGSMVPGSGGTQGTADAVTQGTASGGYPPYTISWTRIFGAGCTLVSQTGNPTSSATWTNPTISTTASTVRMTVTDSATPTPGTAFANTTIQWNVQ